MELPGAKNVQEKTSARLKQELMAHVRAISHDGSGLPGIIMDNHVRECVCVRLSVCISE